MRVFQIKNIPSFKKNYKKPITNNNILKINLKYLFD